MEPKIISVKVKLLRLTYFRHLDFTRLETVVGQDVPVYADRECNVQVGVGRVYFSPDPEENFVLADLSINYSTPERLDIEVNKRYPQFYGLVEFGPQTDIMDSVDFYTGSQIVIGLLVKYIWLSEKPYLNEYAVELPA